MNQQIPQTLHIINKNLNERSLYQNCINSILPGDAIVLIESAVYAIFDNDCVILNSCDVPIYVLDIDMLARGLETKFAALLKNDCKATSIDDDKFVSLCCQYQKTISWF